jgi:dCMP deaminase
MKFDEICMDLAIKLATNSHCVKNQVGAVIAKDTRIISTGYNGPPSGTYNCDDEWGSSGCPRSIRGGCSLAIHAEQNAITYAINNGASIKDASIYITLSPCLPCAKMIFAMGIKKVVYLNSYAEYKYLDTEEGLNFLKEFSIHTIKYEKK